MKPQTPSLVLRLGTRKSLLAVAQSSWVARELEARNPNVKIELVGIETKGDVVLDKPLSQIEGKEFFTAELDRALIRGEVDLTVHSMKDLSLDRPPQLQLGAAPSRELPHDIIVFHESVRERLKNGQPIRIGTSSPRRLTLVPQFLQNALPQMGRAPVLQFVEIRGNVNTRLSRIHESENTDKKLDGVVLAFAGLERLAMDTKASIELFRLLEQTKLMVIPLNACPSAPAQGALAIEVRSDDSRTYQIVHLLHDPETLTQVLAERKILGEWGGGCHQKLGATAIGPGILKIKGLKPDGVFVDETRGESSEGGVDFVRVESADIFDFKALELSDADKETLQGSRHLFIAHSRAYEFLKDHDGMEKKHIWVSGQKSWFKLAAQGLWIEGSLEGQGFQSLSRFQEKKLLRFTEPFVCLTHQESSPPNGAVHLATYRHEFREIPEKIQFARSVYWGSGLSFQTLWQKLGPEFWLKKEHLSGPGKTAEILEETLAPYGVKNVSTFQS